MRLARRQLLLAAAAMVAAGCSPRRAATGCAALAGKTIRWIVPFGDGGSYEILSRLIEPFYERVLGAEIVIATEPGNGGVVGATKLRDAGPDGQTLGVLNAPGLFSVAVGGDRGSPNPARDFSILGLLGRARPLFAVPASSPIRNMDDLIERQKTKPLLCGSSGVGSNSLLIYAVCESILGLRFDYIAGYSGSRESQLAALRGELDLINSNSESLLPLVEQGEMRPLLQVADGPDDNPLLKDVPWLGGPQGWASRRAAQLGRDIAQASADATGLIELAGSGILVAAPKGLSSELRSCLRDRFFDVASSPAAVAAAQKAGRTLDIETGERTQAQLLVAESHVPRFAPLVLGAFARARK